MENDDIAIKTAHDKLFKNKNKNYIFIYTPPKVGSTTLVSSLRVSLGVKFNIIHIHDEVMMQVLTGIKGISINKLITYIANNGNNVYVIDIYRLPIERKMSEFFEKLSDMHFNNTETNVIKYDIKRISVRFNELFPHLSNTDHYFDKYEINVPPFDFIKKYSMQTCNRVKYIKLRLMDSKNWGNILSEIMNTKIVILNDYKTSDKSIGDFYNKFKQEYLLPANLFELMKNCKYLNFYLNEADKLAYFRSWRNKLTTHFEPFTNAEYQLYIRISLENQVYDNVQHDHYIDNGCGCKACSLKRKEIYFKALKGEPVNDKIIHNDEIKSVIAEGNKKIICEVKQKIKETTEGKKFAKNQFLIKNYGQEHK
jgi:hypothetical protein